MTVPNFNILENYKVNGDPIKDRMHYIILKLYIQL